MADEHKECSHGRTFSERCIDCELVSAREGERWALESLTKYRDRIEKLEREKATEAL